MVGGKPRFSRRARRKLRGVRGPSIATAGGRTSTLLFAATAHAAQAAAVTGRVLGRDDWLQQIPLFVVVLAFVVTVDALVFVRITRSRRRSDRSVP